jgi:DNA-binding MarR family transcriptional regulator
MTPRSTAADGAARAADQGPAGQQAFPVRQRSLDSGDGLDQAGRVWAMIRTLAVNYPPKLALRAALNLGRGSGRVKALLCLIDGPQSLTELAEAVQVDAPYATLIVDNLEERGLVERRSDPADRRRKLVALTPEGTTAARRALQVIQEPPPGFGTLSPAELDTLEQLVLRIAGGSAPPAG